MATASAKGRPNGTSFATAASSNAAIATSIATADSSNATTANSNAGYTSLKVSVNYTPNAIAAMCPSPAA